MCSGLFGLRDFLLRRSSFLARVANENLPASPTSFYFSETSSKLEFLQNNKPPVGAAFHLLVDPERETALRNHPADDFSG
jgi:hypothetical protein